MTFDRPAFKGDDYDFALGSVKGLRSWQIDDKGRLRGITHPAVWLPGENASTCRVKTRCPSSPMSDGLFYDRPTLGPRSLDKNACKVDGCDGIHHPTTHTFDPNCECGFWAYDEAGFKPCGQVTGVIEGFGRTTIGTKGFRCEKARVVALARENDDGALSLSEWLRLKNLYPEATFHDDVDDMVLSHGAVLRSWPAVDEGFWDEDESAQAEPLASYWAKMNAQILASYGPPSYRFGRGGL